MRTRGNLPAEVVSLRYLIKQVTERRNSHLEEMAKGVEDREYRKLVGRAAEAKWLIESIRERLKNLDFGEDADG